MGVFYERSLKIALGAILEAIKNGLGKGGRGGEEKGKKTPAGEAYEITECPLN